MYTPQFEGRKNSLEFWPGTVRGYRAWDVSEMGGLLGLFYKQEWLPGINDAVCLDGKSTNKISPYPMVLPEKPAHGMDTCKHGFYAFYNGSNDWHLAKNRIFQSYVEGMIENTGYGEVFIGSRGFRCMHAKIVALTIDRTRGETQIDPEKERLVRLNYSGIPIFDDFDTMLAAYPQIELEDEDDA